MRNAPILLAGLACIALAAPIAARAAGSNVALGDVNGDGKPDLHAGGATSAPGHPPPKSGLIVSSYQTGGSGGASQVVVADVNGDGHPDLHAGAPGGGSSTGGGAATFKACATGQHIKSGALACAPDTHSH